MKKKCIIFGVIALIFVLLALVVLPGFQGAADKEDYQYGEVIRGNIENTISSSGMLSPVTTVDVGTQVSGTIAKVYVDYNDQVKKGQLLAVLDAVLLKAAVLEAEANVEKSDAMLNEAKTEEQRNRPLFEKSLISETEYLPLQTNVKKQQAALKSARAGLQRAQKNLEYAVIRSPINGRVITKNVEAGQTVAANFATPTLFEIAEDLTHMEILVSVDESDIGMVKEGQNVRFEVLAYEDKTFHGTVKQIRLQPKNISNVINYTVVVEAKNDEQLLLPGMTATVEFLIEEKKDALLVPKSALLFQPGEKEIRKFHVRKRKEFEALPDSVKEKMQRERKNRMSKETIPEDAGQVWFIDDDGNLDVEPVLKGSSDGKYTEIVKCRLLAEGMKMITGKTKTDSKKSSKNKKQVFQNTQPRGGPGR